MAQPAGPQARDPSPAPALAPSVPGRWRGAVGAGGAEPCAGHGLGVRDAGLGGRRAGRRAGKPSPCLVPPRSEPRCRGGAVGPGRPRWQLPGPRQRKRGGCLRALRPVSGAGAPVGWGTAWGSLTVWRGLGTVGRQRPPEWGLGFMLRLRDAGSTSCCVSGRGGGGTFWGVEGECVRSCCQSGCKRGRGGDADPLRHPSGRRSWRCEDVHLGELCAVLIIQRLDV